MLMLAHWASGCRCRRDHRRDHPLFADADAAAAAAAAAGPLPAAAEVTVAVHQLQRFIAIIVGLFPVVPEEAHGRVRESLHLTYRGKREAGGGKGNGKSTAFPWRRRRRRPHTQRGPPAPAGPYLLVGCVPCSLRPSPPVPASLPGSDWSSPGKSRPVHGYRQEPGPFA